MNTPLLQTFIWFHLTVLLRSHYSLLGSSAQPNPYFKLYHLWDTRMLGVCQSASFICLTKFREHWSINDICCPVTSPPFQRDSTVCFKCFNLHISEKNHEETSGYGFTMWQFGLCKKVKKDADSDIYLAPQVLCVVFSSFLMFLLFIY